MNSVQVIIEKDGRVWDSIKPNKFLALKRIAGFLKESDDLELFIVGKAILERQRIGQTYAHIIDWLVSSGFEVTLKGIGEEK